MDILIEQYEAGRKDMYTRLMWVLQHADYHMSRKELIELITEIGKEEGIV